RRHTRFSRDWSSDVCSSDLAPLPAKVSRRQAGIDVDFWPAWVEQGEAVVEQLFDNPLQAAQAHRHGVQRLLLQRLPEQVKYLRQKLTTAKEAAIYYRDLEIGRAHV